VTKIYIIFYTHTIQKYTTKYARSSRWNFSTPNNPSLMYIYMFAGWRGIYRAFTAACVCVFIPSVILFFFLCWKRSFVSAVCRQRTRGLQQQSYTSVTAFDRRGGCRYLRGRHLSLVGRNHRPIKMPFSRPCIYNIIKHTHSHNSHIIIYEGLKIYYIVYTNNAWNLCAYFAALVHVYNNKTKFNRQKNNCSNLFISTYTIYIYNSKPRIYVLYIINFITIAYFKCI